MMASVGRRLNRAGFHRRQGGISPIIIHKTIADKPNSIRRRAPSHADAPLHSYGSVPVSVTASGQAAQGGASQ